MGRPKNTEGQMTKPLSVRLFPEQRKKLKDTARKVQLSELDCLRKAIDFGLPALESALNPEPQKAA